MCNRTYTTHRYVYGSFYRAVLGTCSHVSYLIVPLPTPINSISKSEHVIITKSATETALAQLLLF